MYSRNIPIWFRRKTQRLSARGASIKSVQRSIAAYERGRCASKLRTVAETSANLPLTAMDMLKAAGFTTV